MLPPLFRARRRQTRFAGPAATVRCALLGANLAVLAEHPRRSDRRGSGEGEVTVEIRGVPIAPGDWCDADPDGVVVADSALHAG